MKKRILNSVFLIISLFSITVAQEINDVRLPYLKGEKYGIVDEKGKTILSYEFDKIKIFNDLDIILGLKNNYWGVYSLNGNLIITHRLSDKIEVSKNKKLNFYSNEFINTDANLIKITDHVLGESYLVNPDFPQKNYPQLKKNYSDNDNVVGDINFNIHKIIRVVEKQGEINFINDKGIKIYEKGFKDGFVISDQLVAISNGEKYAIQKGNKTLTEYIYSKVYLHSLNGNFVCQLHGKNEDGKRFKEYHFFNADGQLIDKSSDFISFKKGLAIINKEKVSLVYDEDGKEKFSFPNQNLQFRYFNKKYFILSQTNKNYGLYDINGKTILDTIYSSMNIIESDCLFTCGMKDYFFVFDTSFHKVLEVDSVFGLYPTVSNKLLKYSMEDGWKVKYGVMDLNGIKINNLIWDEVAIYNCGDLVSFKNDSISLLYSHVSREVIYPKENKNSEFVFSIDCDYKLIKIKEKGINYVMDFDGSNLRISEHNNIKKVKNYKPVRIGGKYKLQDSNGNFGINESFEKIDFIYNNNYSKIAYICQADKNIHNSKVLNSDLRNILPEGYSYSKKKVHSEKNNHGFVFVINHSDFQKNSQYYRSGLIDLNGNWIIKPFYGKVEFVHINLIFVNDYEQKNILLYNAKGKKVSDKKYDFLAEHQYSRFNSNRIAVGIYQDKTYPKKIEKIQKEYTDYTSIKKEIDKLGEPVILYGFVNKVGKEIIKPQFINTDNYWNDDMTKFVYKIDRTGKRITQKIDTIGNVILNLPFDEVLIIDKSHYKVKKANKWAISDTLGNLLTPFKFDDIEKETNVLDGLLVGRDSLKTYIISPNCENIYEIDGLISDIYPINKESFYVKQSYKYKEGTKNKYGYRYFLLSNDMELIEKYEDLNSISASFGRAKLPNGYISINRKGEKPYVFHLVSKIPLKD